MILYIKNTKLKPFNLKKNIFEMFKNNYKFKIFKMLFNLTYLASKLQYKLNVIIVQLF